MSWNKLICNVRELQLSGTLNGGQSFRWEYNKEIDEWTGVFSKTVWKLRQRHDLLQYKVVGSLLSNKEINKNGIFEILLKKYFRLDFNLSDYYTKWSEKDDLFKAAGKQFYGIRMLAQEPVENLFSFICSQNNHISRISSMVEKLCKHYGEEICEHDGTTYYSFPDVEKLANPKGPRARARGPCKSDDPGGCPACRHCTAFHQFYLRHCQEAVACTGLEVRVESELRQLGFGYRAKFIQRSAAQIVEWEGEKWFTSLQDMKYREARLELMKLCGIGPKVADCICLMSLNHLEALPVDTHVYQIAAQNYLPHLRGKKSVTDKMYTEIGDHFRNLYGDLAGWAHTVLFCADLKKFQNSGDSEDVKPKKRRKK